MQIYRNQMQNEMQFCPASIQCLIGSAAVPASAVPERGAKAFVSGVINLSCGVSRMMSCVVLSCAAMPCCGCCVL